jgi:hypothetical protein
VCALRQFRFRLAGYPDAHAIPRLQGDFVTKLIALLLAGLEYALAESIGLPSIVALVIAIQVGLLAATFVWLGGVPHDGPGLGRRW